MKAKEVRVTDADTAFVSSGVFQVAFWTTVVNWLAVERYAISYGRLKAGR